jgi:hypothetical protein
MAKRECGSCTKCCEGWLEGEALGHKFYPGKPCHYVTIGKGCNSYALRPKEPCVIYKCGWIGNIDLPDWLKPNQSNVIVNYATIEDVTFIRLIETGQTLSSKALTWVLKYALSHQINLAWTIDGELHWIGSTEFNLLMLNQEHTRDKFPHSKSRNLPLV